MQASCLLQDVELRRQQHLEQPVPSPLLDVIHALSFFIAFHKHIGETVTLKLLPLFFFIIKVAPIKAGMDIAFLGETRRAKSVLPVNSVENRAEEEKAAALGLHQVLRAHTTAFSVVSLWDS